MACYVITFEPIPASAGETLRERIKTLGGYCPIHAYCWAVVTQMTAAQLRDYLMQSSPTSRIFVVRSGTEAAWKNSYGEKYNEWLKQYL